ncbi:hypothetical protein Msil_0203 [Methylocella silvestris BL2]|uniref:DUF4436 domain-containing protein n=1 Tax=Methylocella silvestris (strain DSM 15510 / CIP 108128 / LMG 27833 / NCIMB 13906 / BL2) TaxID=395965 RepID=B8EN49_METSB|nr:DUF4436 family protein [Methylocella silvestris]ACK49184.1 hypothetical protein Msil_0203 [Methylocella silvestris BL2]
MSQTKPSPFPKRRAFALIFLVAAAALVYAAALRTFDLTEIPTERSFAKDPDAAQRIKIYIEPISVDPANEAIQFRVHVAPGRGMPGKRPNSADRDLNVIVRSGDAVEQQVFRAHEPMTFLTIGADLNQGSIARYPFDRYVIDLRVQALEGAEATPEHEQAIALDVTVWEGLLGYQIRSSMAPGGDAGDLRLRFDLRRADAHVFFALATYGAMIVLACSSLLISFLVFLGYRKPEAAPLGALAALVFALPALRNALPLAPPLGVWADVLVFLWAELAAVLGLALFVVAWAREKPFG